MKRCLCFWFEVGDISARCHSEMTSNGDDDPFPMIAWYVLYFRLRMNMPIIELRGSTEHYNKSSEHEIISQNHRRLDSMKLRWYKVR
ncbi:hypothetical protein TNCT_260931 [Trichonephila clavata]|uniref:Uncharacterized protein n=1 Tax=Trichonephila clavata TaxID=2740835 RepID=A0A8X6LQN8_TRICU|nr:hypothetical protein TNCT_260931 [Trichonephila clavata]